MPLSFDRGKLPLWEKWLISTSLDNIYVLGLPFAKVGHLTNMYRNLHTIG
jgi:hypothetical protein